MSTTHLPSPSLNPRQADGGALRLALAMRALLLALLLILPLQFSWAATARYCAHGEAQSQPEGQHPGHHSHQHRAEQGQAVHEGRLTFTPTAASQLPDADCGFCHASIAPYAVTATRSLGTAQLASVQASACSPPFSTRADHRIDRPNWSTACRTDR